MLARVTANNLGGGFETRCRSLLVSYPLGTWQHVTVMRGRVS